MTSKCPYASLLGIPGKGVHSTRFMGLALNDMIATVVAAFITTFFIDITFLQSLLAWFVVGEVLHWVFGVDTAFLRMIGVPRIC